MNKDVSIEEAKQWLKENEHKRYLGHGSAIRHEMYVAKMKKIISKGERIK